MILHPGNSNPATAAAVVGTCQVDDNSSNAVVLLASECLEDVASVPLHQLERYRAVVVLKHARIVVQHRQTVTYSSSSRRTL